MPGRFEFERAIRRSDLPPLSRLLALTIATWANANTGIIAPQHQPSQSVLLQATGMGKGTFLTHRKTLEKDGWIKYGGDGTVSRSRGRGQNGYSLHIPVRSGADLTGGDDGSGADLSDRSGVDPTLGRLPTTRVSASPERQSQPPPKPAGRSPSDPQREAAAPSSLRSKGLPSKAGDDHVPAEDPLPVVRTATIPARARGVAGFDETELADWFERAVLGLVSREEVELVTGELDRLKRHHMQECGRCQQRTTPCPAGAPLVGFWAQLSVMPNLGAPAPF